MLTIREVIKTFYNALLQRFKKYRGNWEQNDPTADDYIKNRPFYSIRTENVTVKNAINRQLERFSIFAIGDTVTVNVDGVEHSLVAYDDDYPTIGDTYSSIDNGEGELGWQIYVDDDSVRFYAAKAHTVSYFDEEVVKLDKKYLPENLATKSEVAAVQTTADNAQNTATTAKTTANNAQSTATTAKTTANTAKTTANAANTTANNALSTASVANSMANTANDTANNAKAAAAKALTVDSTGTITVPINVMNNGTYPNLLLSSQDSRHNASFRTTGSIGLKILVDRDGGLQSNVLNPSTVEFIANGGKCMRLKGIDELIMNSSTTNSTKEFRITVDDSGKPTFTNLSDSADSYTPTDLPSVTSSDSGKFLRVSSAGEWVAETIPNASGVSF